jgi:serine/threonine-protein kinase HipA
VSYRQVDIVEVRAWGQTVGAVALDPRSGFYAFEYDESWAAGRRELAPLHLPNGSGAFVFPELSRGTYYGLPALLADALPDRFGNALVNAWLAEQGVPRGQITALDRLAYAADRAMGALTFHPPADQPAAGATAIQLADLVAAARSSLVGEAPSTQALHEALSQLIQVGTSAGGARAKAVVAYNPATDQLRSGQVDAPEGFEHWLLKLDGMGDDPELDDADLADADLAGADLDDTVLGESAPYCRIEYAYFLMARAAGVEMAECRLLPEGPRTHFLTRRFDRPGGGERVHLQSLCAVAHLDFNLVDTHSYSQYLATVKALSLGADALEQAYRRMVFNVAAENRDDHTKNFAFLMPSSGAWALAPAYDLTHAHNPAGVWTRRHQLSVNGKFDGIGYDDLLAVGDRHLVPGYREVIDDVRGAVARWPEYAAAAGLTEQHSARIAADLAAHKP